MPTEGTVGRRFGRVHTDVRISLTDRCNFRCRYCLQRSRSPGCLATKILGFEEIVRVASVARKLGVRTLASPAASRSCAPGVTELVRMVAQVGFADVSLTTNGVLLALLADELAQAGLRRVNVSCDSLRRCRFREIAGRDALPRVLAAMDAAEARGSRRSR